MADLKEILSDICDSIDGVAGNNNALSRRVSFLEALVNQDAELKRKYEAAKQKMDRGMGGAVGLKQGLRAKIQSLA
jgi:hypothetical protein